MFGFFKKKPPPPNQQGPDFSPIDSRAKAEELLRKGQLEKLLLLPLEFGGEDVAENAVYVHVGLAGAKAGIDRNIIGPLILQEKVTQYSAVPKYQGNSLIPISIEIRVWDPQEFATSIQIWGKGLSGRNG
jgi:hypothetical protein